MRLILAIGALMASCAASDAAPTHRAKAPPRDARSAQPTTAGGYAVPGWSAAQTKSWIDEATGPRD